MFVRPLSYARLSVAIFFATFFALPIPLYAQSHHVLTQTAAELRSQQIQNVDYQIELNLLGKRTFSAKTKISFDLTPKARNFSPELHLDFTGAKIRELLVNGHEAAYRQTDTEIIFNLDDFNAGERNLISVRYTRAYNHDGDGLHEFTEPDGSDTYIYSNLEPNQANQVFPCFDQPDLKASYALTVIAPEAWQVIANTLESDVRELKGAKKWIFRTTERFSTYLFAMAAGPYQKWESDADGIPLRLFAPKSLAPYVEAEFWFAATREGFRFYQSHFGVPYPFGKYDQIICHEFNAGAMENVGAVTFSDSLLSRAAPTPASRIRLAEVIHHEMAHMWFGDLVTMRWWDDLWLNESFATFAAYLVMADKAQILKLPDPWQRFFSSEKIWAYDTDGSVTTHPIVGTAVDTQEAKANFDGITYGKGAAVLKQLFFLIGPDAFYRGLNLYFHRYAFGNATRSNFLASLGEAAGMDLSGWTSEWLMTSGTNSVEVKLDTRDGKIANLQLLQEPDKASGILRTHRTRLGLFDRNESGKIVFREAVDATYQGATTSVTEAIGKPAPVFVFPNYGDHDFVHTVLDTESLNVIESSLSDFEDPSIRNMLWIALWKMVEDGKLPAQRFAQVAMHQLPAETSETVLGQNLGNLRTSTSYMSERWGKIYRARIEAFVLEHALSAEPGTPIQRAFYYALVPSARSPELLSRFERWLDEGKTDFPALEFGQAMRWNLIQALSRENVSGSAERIAAERVRDPSDYGEKEAIIAEVLRPDSAVKREWWKRITSLEDTRLSDAKLKMAMAYFHVRAARKLTEFMENEFFQKLLELSTVRTPEFMQYFAGSMHPSTPCAELLDRSDRFTRENEGRLPTTVTRELRNEQQRMIELMRGRNLSESWTE